MAGNLMRRDCSLLSQAFFMLKGPQAKEGLKEIERYRAIVKRWNEKKGKMGECLDFLIRQTADFKE